jgi:hypothetical protein
MSVLAIAGISAASAAVIRQGELRLTVLAQVLPYKLPRTTTAPIAVFVSGHIAAVDGSVPPQLARMSVKVNRHGLLDDTGLPTCRFAQIRTATSAEALRQCADALVGSGRFWATVVFPDQRPYPTRGRLLIFNGREAGRPVLFAHIFTTDPFITSFLITFAISHLRHGTYGTELTASLPKALGNWGFVDRIKLTLRRKYTYRGKQRSYFNAGCPAPKGTHGAAFALARADFDFAGHQHLGLTVTKSCGVAG